MACFVGLLALAVLAVVFFMLARTLGDLAVGPEADRAPMLRAAAPWRLALLRALLVAGVSALPALLLAVSRGPDPKVVAWLVIAAHVGLAVVAASLAEAWGARGRRHADAAAAAGLAAVVLGVAAVPQGAYASVAFSAGPEAAWTALAAAMPATAREALAMVVGWSVILGLVWGLPVAAVTYDECERKTSSLVIVSGLTFGAAVPGVVLLVLAYQLAEAASVAFGDDGLRERS